MDQTIANRLTLSERAANALDRAKGVDIEMNIETYLDEVSAVRGVSLADRSGADLAALATGLRGRAEAGESLDALLPITYALVAEASARTLALSPHDEQILAGIVLHRGKVAQMQTGEGKTLAAVFAAALNALEGRGAHVLTANDYLARRDAEWMGPVYRSLGLSVGHIQETMAVAERQAAYGADVTYATAREAGFDLLRDQLRYRKEDVVHRGFPFCIVDEIDFILIDEARIPLVIAGASPRADVDPRRADEVAGLLAPDGDFVTDRGRRRVSLTVQGYARVEELYPCGGVHEEQNSQVFAAVTMALHARHLLTRDVDYIVRASRIELVDELTGRVAGGRRWPYGLQSALEAKEGLELQAEGLVYGSITTQHFAALYERLCGLTATAVPAAPELSRFYDLGTVVIPPHRPVVRVDAPDRVFTTLAAKHAAIVDEVRSVHATGRPILIGTTSVKASAELADLLRGQGIHSQVLNAKDDSREAELIARAGALAAVTVSTNMAGRGTDIRLGGEESAERERILALGGLYVIGTARHESVRIDNQLRGRAGRQGDPGLSRFFVSLEDQIVERYAITELIPLEHRSLREAREIADPRVAREIARAQGIIDTQNHQIRRALRRHSEIVERQRRHLQEIRRRVLFDALLPDELQKRCRAHVEELSRSHRPEWVREALARSYLSSLDRRWAGHLLFIDDVKEGIHLHRYAGEDPFLFYVREVDDAFQDTLDSIEDDAVARFHGIDAAPRDDTLPGEELQGPSGTWTYLVSDDPLPAFRLNLLSAGVGGAAAAAVAAMPLVLAALAAGAWSLVRRLTGRRRRRKAGPPY